MKQKQITHLDKSNNPGMVDVSAKSTTERSASASGTVTVGTEVMEMIREGDFQTKKGRLKPPSLSLIFF